MIDPKKRATLEEAEIAARDLGRLIQRRMPDGFAFFLLLASFGEKGVTTYLSSARREDAIKMLREMATHLENNGKEL